ncbi:acyltransferase family protein [Corynebacterium aurimucosum]|nr:acyltransferase family protein [Corynebacterium aurimucosum]
MVSRLAKGESSTSSPTPDSPSASQKPSSTSTTASKGSAATAKSTPAAKPTSASPFTAPANTTKPGKPTTPAKPTTSDKNAAPNTQRPSAQRSAARPGRVRPRPAEDFTLDLSPSALPKASAVKKAKLVKAREEADVASTGRRAPRRPLPRRSAPQPAAAKSPTAAKAQAPAPAPAPAAKKEKAPQPTKNPAQGEEGQKAHRAEAKKAKAPEQAKEPEKKKKKTVTPGPENEISRALARRSQSVGVLSTKQEKQEKRRSAKRPIAKESTAAAVAPAAATAAAADATTASAMATTAAAAPATAPAAAGASTSSTAAPSTTAPATTPRRRRARLRQIPGLDGLRGLAVLAVVIYHFFGDILPGGYLGVDMFFVLSGFLITSLLVREFNATGRISLKDFWLRRFRRILPAALVVLSICTAIVALIGGDLAVGIRQQFLGTFFFVNNWTQIATSQTYFAPNEVQVFAHYWSLAVEEQFYLIWPLLMFGIFAISRRKPKRLPIAVSLILTIASAVAMALIFTPGEDPTRVYYGTDTHAFGLLIGAILSLLLTSTDKDVDADSWPAANKGILAGTVGALALVAYLAQLVWMGADREFTYRGGLVLTSVLGAAMIWGVVRETGPLTRIFRTPVMRWLGQRSFSLYLWHWPVVMIIHAMSDAPSWLLGLLCLPLSCLLAEVTYQFVENPFRRAGFRPTWHAYWAARPSMEEIKASFGKALWPAVPVIVVLSLLGVGYALVTSEDKSELERELERMAQSNEQAASSAPAQPTETTKPKEKRAIPTGNEISAIGDSVMLAASEALNERFPGISIDAAISRHYSAALPVVQGLKDSGQLRSTVFVGLGTNGATFEGQMDELIDIVGSERTLVLVLPYGERDWMGPARAEIIEAATTHDNVYIADWCGVAQENPAMLYDDGVHPLPEGAHLYADALYDALEQYADEEKNLTTVCSS